MSRRGSWMARALTLAGLLFATGVIAAPFYWMVITSVKPAAEVVRFPPGWWPSVWAWSNYREAWNSAPFGRFFLNSLVTASVATTLQVGFALTMAYAFVRVRFPLKPVLFLGVIATMAVPDEIRLIPNVILMRDLGWIDTYQGLIVPVIAHGFPVFVLHEHLKGLPRDYFEAASLDGAGHWGALWHVAAPLSRPMLAATAVLALVGRWNDFLWPLVVTNRESMRTLPVGLSYLQDSQDGGMQWHLLMAASVFVMMPMLIVYVFGQRFFERGISEGALKG